HWPAIRPRVGWPSRRRVTRLRRRESAGAIERREARAGPRLERVRRERQCGQNTRGGTTSERAVGKRAVSDDRGQDGTDDELATDHARGKRRLFRGSAAAIARNTKIASAHEAAGRAAVHRRGANRLEGRGEAARQGEQLDQIVGDSREDRRQTIRQSA